jgi:hypothetical protein
VKELIGVTHNFLPAMSFLDFSNMKLLDTSILLMFF